jgi:hypothetical protein
LFHNIRLLHQQRTRFVDGLELEVTTPDGVDQYVRKHRHPSAFFARTGTFHRFHRDQHTIGVLEVLQNFNSVTRHGVLEGEL